MHFGGNDIGTVYCINLVMYFAKNKLALFYKLLCYGSGKMQDKSWHKKGHNVIKHNEFQDKSPHLFAEDGVHLSFLGNDIFHNTIQGALETFIKHPEIVVYRNV